MVFRKGRVASSDNFPCAPYSRKLGVPLMLRFCSHKTPVASNKLILNGPWAAQEDEINSKHAFEETKAFHERKLGQKVVLFSRSPWEKDPDIITLGSRINEHRKCFKNAVSLMDFIDWLFLGFPWEMFRLPRLSPATQTRLFSLQKGIYLE